MVGRWDVTIDNKWRLNIPAALQSQVDNFVLLEEGEDGCIKIKKPPLKADEDPTSIFIIEVEQRKYGKRILIPQSLRGSTSFFYGRKVTLAGKGDYLELWPRR